MNSSTPQPTRISRGCSTARLSIVGIVLSGTLVCAAFGEPRATNVEVAGTGTICGDSTQPRSIELTEAVMESLQSQPQLIIAQQDAAASRSELTASIAPFLPSVQLGLGDERYVPSHSNSPVIVVGNTVLGGAQTKSAYGSLSLSWNIMSSGRDIAAYHGAKADVRAASSGLDSQLEDTLTGVLQADAELYEAEVAARGGAGALAGLKAILARADERFRNGHGTTVAIGQARAAALDSERTLNGACRTIADKSAALAQAAGIRIPVLQSLSVGEPLPMPILGPISETDLDASVESNPAVAAAKERVAAARAKLLEATRGFGPTLSLSVRRDYLGQDPQSFGEANHHIAPNDYRIGLAFEQPLFPLVSEAAQVGKARAQWRRAQASYDEARLDAQTKFRSALSARREARASYMAAQSSLAESARVLSLTQSLYKAGRTDLDSVEHAQMDRDKAATYVQTLESKRAFAEWAAVRVLQPAEFPNLLFGQLHLQVQAQRWRDGDQPAPSSDSNSSY
ncbi:MAG: TolC family protein [Gammaproteobacteria bacterium]|nr:TolC family protein [Gammaproteobacteria bacterium]